MDLDDLFKHLGGHGRRAHHRHGHREDRHHPHREHDGPHDDRYGGHHHQRDDGFGGDRQVRRHGHLDRRDDWQARGHGPFGSKRAILMLLARHKWMVAAALGVGALLLVLAAWILVTVIEAVAPSLAAIVVAQVRSILAMVAEATAGW